MKYLVLRTDLRKKLDKVKLILVDSNIFSRELDTGIDNMLNKLISDNLGSIISKDVRLVIYNYSTAGNKTENFSHNYINYKSLNGIGVAELIRNLKIEFNVSDDKIVFLNATEDDPDLLSKIGFPASTIDAPLEVKINSFYVSNSTGTEAFNEVIDIILRAKTN